MSFFVTATEDGYLLTTAGYVAFVILLAAALIGAVILAKKTEKKEKKFSTKRLVFCAMAVALAMVTSVLKVFSFPFGGSITLFSMLFASLAGYFYGPATGILTGAAYGILQLIIEPYIYFPVQVLVITRWHSGLWDCPFLLQCEAWPDQGLCGRNPGALCVRRAVRMAVFRGICLGGLGSASLFPGIQWNLYFCRGNPDRDHPSDPGGIQRDQTDEGFGEFLKTQEGFA